MTQTINEIRIITEIHSQLNSLPYPQFTDWINNPENKPISDLFDSSINDLESAIVAFRENQDQAWITNKLFRHKQNIKSIIDSFYNAHNSPITNRFRDFASSRLGTNIEH